MINSNRSTILFIAALAISGCASYPQRTSVTYSSNADGASIADGCVIRGIVYVYNSVEDLKAGKLSTLPGAVVRVEGTGKGAHTLNDGSFYIIGLKKGTYSVTTQMLGFEITTREKVIASEDKMANIFFYLRPKIGVVY